MLPSDDQNSPRQVKSLLSRAQRLWLTIALALAALLLANTLYLLTNRLFSSLPGESAASLADGIQTISHFFQIMVLSHTGLGFIVVGLFVVFAIWHLPKVWRRHRRRAVISGVSFATAGAVLAVTGPFIMQAAASREHTWVWWTHVIAAVIVPVAYIVHRSLSFVRPVRGNYARFGGALSAAFAVMLVAHVFSNRERVLTPEAKLAKAAGSYTGPGSKERDLRQFVDGPYVPDGFVPPASPFFPSNTTTTTGDYLPHRIITRGEAENAEKLAEDLDTIGFVVNTKIGAETCERCHADIVDQWSKSAHRFASFNNPFYEATINDMRKNAVSMTDGVEKHVGVFPHWEGRTGEIKSKWCSGCHDPSLMLAGKMADPIDRRSTQAQAGLTCLACHAIDETHNNAGNGNYNIADEEEDPYLFPMAEADTLAAYLHDTAIKAKPEAHKRQMLKPFFRSSEFCAACHKVSLPMAVNDYRWFRGQNEYDNWHDSGVALNAARTFYLPPVKKVCQECHMPLEPAVKGDFAAKDGMVRSHRFLAVNTALPHLRDDQDTIARIEAFLRDEKLRIEVFALVRDGDEGAETTYAISQTRPPLIGGERATFDVVVRNVGVGHTFPGGTNDSNEGWVEFTVLDEKDNVLFQSGGVGDDGYVDPAAHYFRALVVDRNGQAIRKRNAQDMYAMVYANVIGPGTAHAVHYGLRIPEVSDLPTPKLKLRARLLWRKFDRGYTEFAFQNNPDGFKKFTECPDLPVTEICRSEITLDVTDSAVVELVAAKPVDPVPNAGGAGASPPKVPEWMRYNDYGIGLLLQGDTKGARKAFAEVARVAPQRVDGPKNLARVALRDGDLREAYEWLLRSEEIAPNDPLTAYFWGQLLLEEGRYVEAASALKRVLQKFPEDRATWRDLGRTYYLDSKYDEAITAMEEVLRIDPEDRIAHYHIMLAARALGRSDRAATAEAAYSRYKIDESAQKVTHTYRLAHPHDNHESQAIHVHDLMRKGSTGELHAERRR